MSRPRMIVEALLWLTHNSGVRNAAHPNEMILKPEAIASMLVHLVSDNSKGVNGAVIPIDNGWSTI